MHLSQIDVHALCKLVQAHVLHRLQQACVKRSGRPVPCNPDSTLTLYSSSSEEETARFSCTACTASSSFFQVTASKSVGSCGLSVAVKHVRGAG